MSNLTPKFLMGGVNMAKNFLGWGTMKAGLWTAIEGGIKTVPLVFFFTYMGYLKSSGPSVTFVTEGQAPAPLRRESLL